MKTLPLSAEKFIISLFRKMLMYDVEIEELQTIQTSTNVRRTNPEVLRTAQEKTGESMDVGEIEDHSTQESRAQPFALGLLEVGHKPAPALTHAPEREGQEQRQEQHPQRVIPIEQLKTPFLAG